MMIKKQLIILSLLCGALQSTAQQFVNGSFEVNSVGSCDVFHFNGPLDSPFYPGNDLHIIPQSNAFSEIWLIRNNCDLHGWGGYQGPAAEGSWFINTVSKEDFSPTAMMKTTFSLKLDAPLQPQQAYKMSWWQKTPPPPQNPMWNYTGLGYPLSFGLSNDSVEWQGMVFHTTPIVDSVWTYMEATFTAPQDSLRYITCTVNLLDTISRSAYLDDFQLEVLTSLPEATTSPPQLLRIVDLLGRETQPKANTPLFYIYDNGRVEKRLVVE